MNATAGGYIDMRSFDQGMVDDLIDAGRQKMNHLETAASSGINIKY